jgi:hypothetical protein
LPCCSQQSSLGELTLCSEQESWFHLLLALMGLLMQLHGCALQLELLLPVLGLSGVGSSHSTE